MVSRLERIVWMIWKRTGLVSGTSGLGLMGALTDQGHVTDFWVDWMAAGMPLGAGMPRETA